MVKYPAVVAALLGIAPVLASTASAQDAQGGRKRDRDTPEFDSESPARSGEQTSTKTTTPEAAFEKALPLLTTWPAEAGETALRALTARGPEMVPLFRARLANGTVLERSAAARGLTLLADRESFAAIEKLFADPRQRTRFTPLLLALRDLDPACAGPLALRFLQSEQAPLRLAARALLRQDPTPETRQALREALLAARGDGVRLDLFELLAELDEPSLPTLALEQFLGAKEPSLAQRATELLSWQDDPRLVAELQELAGGARERRNLHAALALVLHEQRTAAPRLPNGLFDHFLGDVRSSDPLLRATAAVTCGMIGYRDEARAESVKSTVLPALAEAVIHGRFFGDFELCFRTGVATLELLTGERLGPSVPAWREWFARNPDARFSGRRELQALVLDEDELDAVVEASRADATGSPLPDLHLCGARHRAPVAAGGRPGTMVVDATAMRGALLALEQHGVFSGEIPRQLSPAQQGDLVVRLSTRGREKVVALRGTDPRAVAIRKSLIHASEAAAWQLLLAYDETYPRRFAEEAAWHTTHPDPATRRSRLVDLALAAVAGADGDGANRAFAALARLEDLGSSVRATQVESLATLLAGLAAGDPRARSLEELLIATGRDDAFDRLVDALGPRGGAATEAIAVAMDRMGKAPRGLADARPIVRQAALLLAERDHHAVAEAALVNLAESDPDAKVRGLALTLLAERGGEAGLKVVLEQARTAPLPVRAEALRLLGRSRREEALLALTAEIRGEESSLVAAALEGLSRRGDGAAADALDALVRERGPADPLGRLALAAIKGLPRELAVGRLRRLLDEQSGALSREAAYGLADLGEMDAVPTLLADLEDERLHRRAKTLLTYLFCRDPGTETWRFRSVHESTPGASHTDHFLSALKEGGALLPAGRDVSDRSFQPLLVAAIEDTRWFVRRSALELLEAAHGRVLGNLATDAGRDEIRALANRWREVISTQADGASR
jgi:HEAT repeat protein